LLLAGVEYLIPIYKSVTDYNNIWEEAITGNLQYEDPKELYAQAMQVMKPYFDKKLLSALTDFGNKSATQLSSSFIENIIPAASFGRVAQLFVKKDAALWGIFNETTNELVLTSDLQEGAENLIQKAIVKTLQAGGDVFLVDAEQMPDNSELAAIFRY
jgi:hypothetical protein